MRISPVSAILVAVVAVLLFTGSNAKGVEPTAFRECGFVATGWVPDHAPEGVQKRAWGTAAIPEGWTPVGGSYNTYGAVLVCR